MPRQTRFHLCENQSKLAALASSLGRVKRRDHPALNPHYLERCFDQLVRAQTEPQPPAVRAWIVYPRPHPLAGPDCTVYAECEDSITIVGGFAAIISHHTEQAERHPKLFLHVSTYAHCRRMTRAEVAGVTKPPVECTGVTKPAEIAKAGPKFAGAPHNQTDIPPGQSIRVFKAKDCTDKIK